MSGEDWKRNFSNTQVNILAGGIENYNQILNLQRDLNQKVNENESSAYILICEHDDVYTCGIHTEHLDSRLKDPVRVERGGSITFHGPGQLVAYYVMNMKHLHTNILGIIDAAHKSEIKLLERMGLPGSEPRLGKETGVWIGRKKIASTGFAIRMNSTFHGTALNITTDLKKFQLINPCGFDSGIMTSFHEITGKNYSMDIVKEMFIQIVIESFAIENYNVGKISEQLSGTAP